MCVTGLVTVTTATHWTLIGKIVILILIQIGGIGVIALTSIIFITLHPQDFSAEPKNDTGTANWDKMEGLVKLVRRVVFCVFGAEAIGAVCCHVCLYSTIWNSGGHLAVCIYFGFCLLQRGDRSAGRDQPGGIVGDPLVNLPPWVLLWQPWLHRVVGSGKISAGC